MGYRRECGCWMLRVLSCGDRENLGRVGGEGLPLRLYWLFTSPGSAALRYAGGGGQCEATPSGDAFLFIFTLEGDDRRKGVERWLIRLREMDNEKVFTLGNLSRLWLGARQGNSFH